MKKIYSLAVILFLAIGINNSKAATIEEIQEFMTLSQKAAEGDPKAMFFMGMSNYEVGRYADAIEWFEDCSKKGQWQSQAMLSSIYFDGKGVERDWVLSRKYLEKSILNGNIEGNYYLAQYYLSGLGGLEQNTKKAEQLLSKACRDKVEKACKQLNELENIKD